MAQNVAKTSHYEHDEDGVVLEGTAVELLDTKALALLNASEIDQQIATARRYPRSLTTFTKEVHDLVSLDGPTAQSCVYALPRAGKTIEGASIRFAEMCNYSWGNTRVGTRIVDIGDEYVTVEGMFFDLQKNTAVKSEVLRRITNRKGERYDADGIQQTAGAAGAIARRNAILTGIPKALWAPMYEAARKVVAGDIKTLANRASDAVKAFAVFGIQPPQIFGLLGIKGFEELTTDHLVTLGGVHTAIREKSITSEAAFAEDKWPKAPAGQTPPRPEKADFKNGKAEPPKEAETAQTEGNATKPAEPAGNVTVVAEVKKAEETKEEAKAGELALAAQGPSKADDFRSWLRDRYKAVDACDSLRRLDDLEDEAAKELEGDELKAWREHCKKRAVSLMPKGKGKK